jgi:predicted transcriptional regulator
MFTGIKHKKKLAVCLLFFLLTSTVGASEYIVNPIPGNQAGASISGEKVVEFEETLIPYWQFLLWLLTVNLISLIDMLLFHVRFVYIIAGFRIAQHVNILDNLSRRNIYVYIKNNPGVYFSEIVENTGLNRGTVQYHLQILETKNKIEAYEDGGKIRYFLNNSDYSEEEKRILVTLQNVTNQRIVSEILNENCNTNIALAREFGVSRATISWYVKNLKETGLIKETKRGRNIIYRINTSYKTLLKRHR